MPPSALRPSPGTAATEEVTAYLEGCGTGCLLADGLPHWGPALKAAGLLDPLAFHRSPGAAHIAATMDAVAGDADPAGDGAPAPGPNCKSTRQQLVAAIMEEISNAANGLDGDRKIPGDSSPLFLKELHAISTAFAAMQDGCRSEVPKLYAARVATPRNARTARFEAPSPDKGADEARPKPPPKAVTGLSRAESDALRGNAAQTLGLGNGYPVKGAPLDECVETIYLDARRKQPCLPNLDSLKIGWQRDGKAILARDRDGGYLKYEALPSAKGPPLTALLREKTCALEAVGLAHSFDCSDPAFGHYECTDRDLVHTSTEDGDAASSVHLGCILPELRELDREIDSACLDPNEDGDIASAYQADKLIRKLWKRLSAALTEEGKVRTISQAIDRIRRRQGEELFDLVADKKPERKPDPDPGSGRYSRGSGKERRRDSGSPRRDRSRSGSPSRSRGSTTKPRSSGSYDAYTRPGSSGGASSSTKPELFGQKHRDACNKAGLCHAHMKHLKHNGSPCQKFKSGDCKYKHFSQADADEFYTDQDLS